MSSSVTVQNGRSQATLKAQRSARASGVRLLEQMYATPRWWTRVPEDHEPCSGQIPSGECVANRAFLGDRP
jgi:hypothetical protein